MDLGLKGRKAIVTGGSLGIGKAIARELAREGADVAIVSRTKDMLEAAAGELATETGRRVIAIPADVTSRTQVDGMVAQAAAQLGGLHILVNSGSPPGGSPSAVGPIENLVDEDLLHDFDVKYVGAVRCARAAIPFMKEQRWGRIINISGLGARQTGVTIGSIRNVGVVALTKNLADELGPSGISVVCVHPGLTRTEATPGVIERRSKAQGISPAEVEKQMASGNVLKRIITADEVAYVCTFLASPKAVAINGDVISAGGGAPGSIHY